MRWRQAPAFGGARLFVLLALLTAPETGGRRFLWTGPDRELAHEQWLDGASLSELRSTVFRSEASASSRKPEPRKTKFVFTFHGFQQAKSKQVDIFKDLLKKALAHAGVKGKNANVEWTQMFTALRILGYPGTSPETSPLMDAEQRKASNKEREMKLRESILPNGESALPVTEFVRVVCSLVASLGKMPYSPIDLSEAFRFFSVSQREQELVSIGDLTDALRELRVPEIEIRELIDAARRSDAGSTSTYFSYPAFVEAVEPNAMKRDAFSSYESVQ